MTKPTLCRIFFLSHHPLTYAPCFVLHTILWLSYPYFMLTCPQHKLVAHPRVTSTGYCVLIDLYLKIFVLLGNFIYWSFFLWVDCRAVFCILLRWMVSKFGSHFLSTLLHSLKCIHFLKCQLLTNILELIQLSGVTLMTLSCLGCSLLQLF